MRWQSLVGFLVIILATLQSVKAKPNNNPAHLKKIVGEAVENVKAEDNLYKKRFREGIDIRGEDFKSVTGALFGGTPKTAADIETPSRLINWVSYLLRKEGNPLTISEVLGDRHTSRLLKCPFESPKSCPDSKYRSYDGVCNNKNDPLRGAAFTPFYRELPPAYETDPSNQDIDDQPRQTGQNGPLPNARAVSRAVHQVEPTSTSGTPTTFLFTAWGQFMAHVITDRAGPEGFNSAHIDCCNQNVNTPQTECFNIDVPAGDPYIDLGTTCLGFARSLETTDINCEIGRREQLNSASSYIDASAVYGVTEERAKYLRTFSGGRMETSDPNQLPHGCPMNKVATKRGFAFVQAGDPRAAEVSPLIGMHTLWVREHNRIAEQLQAANPDRTDEELFQECRRIVSAIIQHITYNEWLPLLVGQEMMNTYNLGTLPSGYYTGYDPDVQAATSNVVATAAMRFGHSLVRPTFNLYEKDYSEGSTPALQLQDLFFRPNFYLMHEQGMMRGLLVDPSQSTDTFMANDLTNHLFETAPGNGGDLSASNIQRGRDHGLPSYNTWRNSFNMAIGTSFGSLPDIPAATATQLNQVYSDPDDIDLFAGGLAETPVSGGVVGPLFANLLARQFSKYRQGDRYWYETNEQPQAFSLGELTQIRGVTLAEIMCNNLDLDTIQPSAFELPENSGNQRVPCSAIQQFDITPFTQTT